MMNEFAIVLFKDELEGGYYLLFKDDNANIKSQIVYGGDINSSPVSILGAASKYPFVVVLINDRMLQKSAHYVEVTFNDGRINRKEFANNGAIIPYDNEIQGSMTYSKIEIYDSEDKIIHSHP